DANEPGTIVGTTMEFNLDYVKILDVSSLSFVQGLDISVKESPIAKHSIRGIRGRSIFLRIPFICDTNCSFFLL
ncbi:unnamed protein product, partial [Rotaria sp. Silwood2]